MKDRTNSLGFCKPSFELNFLFNHHLTLIHLVDCLDSMNLKDKILLYMSLCIN